MMVHLIFWKKKFGKSVYNFFVRYYTFFFVFFSLIDISLYAIFTSSDVFTFVKPSYSPICMYISSTTYLGIHIDFQCNEVLTLFPRFFPIFPSLFSLLSFLFPFLSLPILCLFLLFSCCFYGTFLSFSSLFFFILRFVPFLFLVIFSSIFTASVLLFALEDV